MARPETGRRGENSEQRILDTAVRLFATRGYAATGIRHIAEAVGVTTSALYYYARTKEDLLLAVMRAGLGELVESGQHAVAGISDPAEQVRALVMVHLTFAASSPERARVIDNEFQWLGEAERMSVIELRDTYERLWADAIATGIERGTFRVDHPSLARLALLEMCNGVAHWYRPAGPLPIDKIVRSFEDMALALLRAPAQTAGMTGT